MRLSAPQHAVCQLQNSLDAGTLVNETRASELAAGRDAPLFYLSYFGWGHPPSHGLDHSQGVVYTHSSVSGTSAMPRHIRSITVHIDGSSKQKKVYATAPFLQYIYVTFGQILGGRRQHIPRRV